MGIYKLFFGQGWEQSLVFYLAAVGLLLYAMWKEYWDVYKYKLKIENSDTSRAISYYYYLKEKNLQVKENGKETVILQEVSNNSKESVSVFNWLSKILFGTETKEKSGDEWEQIYNSWSSEHLVDTETDDKFEPKVQGSRFVLLQYPDILQKPIPRSHWRFVPGILTAIGVLGTFYGISAGLADISLNNIGADSQNLLKSSVTLLEGMKTAFATSLVGLGFSSLFTLFLAFCDRVRRQSQGSLRDELDKIAVLEAPMRLLSNMNPDGNKRASQSLADPAENMGNAAEQMVKKFDKLIGIQQDELTALREIKAELGQEMLTKLVEKQREQLIKPIIEELKNSAKLTEEASKAVMALKNELGGISRILSESTVTIQKFQQVATEVKDAVNQSIVAMKDQQKAFDVSAEKTADTFKGIREELKKSLETQTQIQQDSIKKFQDSSREIFAEQSTSLKQVGEEASQAMRLQCDAFTASTQQTADTFRGIREELEKSLETQLQIQRDSIKEFQNSTREIFAEQSTNLKQVGKEACQAMIVQREAFTASAEKTADTFRGICKQLEESLQTQAQIQRDSIKELDEQRRGLADVVTKFQTVFEKEYDRRTAWSQEMQESLIKIQKTTNVVSNLVNTIGLNSGERLKQLQELADTIGGEASRVEKAYKKLHQNFDEGLGTWKQELKDYFQLKAESDRKFFTEADEATAQVCNQLLQAANYLVSAESTRRNSNKKD